MTVPIEDPEFWKERIYSVVAQNRPIHQIIYNDSSALWEHVQEETMYNLKKQVRSAWKVLDAGCGFGGVLECLEKANIEVDYTGVDLSPDLIRIANLRHRVEPERGGRRFLVGDLRSLPFPNSQFDIVIARSVEGPIKGNVGYDVWDKMLIEMRRVCKYRVLLLNYPTKTDERMEVRIVHK